LPQDAPATFWRPRSRYAREIVGATAFLTLASIVLCCWVEPALLVATGCIPCGAGAGVGVYILLRSVRLSAVAGLTTAGVAALSFALLIVSGCLSTAAHLGVAEIFVDSLVAAALVLWQLKIAATEISAGAATDAAAWTARNRTLRPGIVSLILVIIPGFVTTATALAALMGAVVAIWFCLVVFPRLIAGSPVPEKTIMRFNRTRELLQRALSPIEFLQESRWALSATGIAAILFALIALDRVHTSDSRTVFAVLEIWNTSAIAFYGTALAIFAIGIVLTRSWREALSIAVAAIWAGTLAAWFVLRTGFNANAFPASNIAATGVAVVAGLLFLVGSASTGKVRDAKEAQQAMTTALAESVSAVVCIAVAALLASGLALSLPGIILSITSAIAALVLLPCFFVAVNALLPRYRSADEVFGRE
jgi:hypothetical protein